MRFAALPLVILSLAAIGIAASPVRTEDRPAAAEPRDAGLRLTSRIPGKPRPFKAGERVPLEVVLTNTTDHEIRFRYLGGWSYVNGKSVEVTRDGKPVATHETILLGAVPILYQVVPAGKSVPLEHPGLWLGEPSKEHRIEPYLVEPLPGKYRVKLYHPNAPGSVKLDDAAEFEIAAG